jgi:hypothetical protein
MLLASSGLFFLIARITSGLKQSIGNAMMWTTLIPGFTMAFIIPHRYTISFLDMNGRPVDVAHYVEAIFGTSLLLHIMGQYTQSQVSSTIKWNAGVFVFGFISIISTEPVSTLCAWLSTMCYAVFLIDVQKMHQKSPYMSFFGLFLSKWISYSTNTLIAVMWFLNRFEVISYPEFVLFDHFLQFCAKAVYGFFVLMAFGQ